MIHRHRGNRRKQDWNKAMRKKHIAEAVYHDDWYKCDGAYRKGKIHCSCAMCSAKTGGSINKSKGPVDGKRGFNRLACTNQRHGKKNYKPSDIRKIVAMDQQMIEFG